VIQQGDLLRVARKYRDLRVHEDPRGGNSGPYINGWLKLCGLGPGHPWCSAAACAWVYEANGNAWPTGFRPSAGGLHLLELNSGLVVPDRDLRPEDIVVFDHGGGASHVVVVESVVDVKGVRFFRDISGNSDDHGSREGWEVCSNMRSVDDARLAGIIRLPIGGGLVA